METVSSTASRNGDLVHRMYLQVAVGAHAAGACASTQYSAMIDNVEVEIGGQRIDRHYGHWLENWAELTEPNVNRSHESG